MTRVLLLGAGHAAVVALRQFATRPLAAEVVVVDATPRPVYSGMIPGAIAGRYRAEDCTIDLACLAKRAGAELTIGRVIAFDAARKTATLDDGRTLASDIVALNTGLAHPALGVGARAIKPTSGLQDWWQALRPGARVIIVGGGASGVELALALGQRGYAVTLVSRAALLPALPAAARRWALRKASSCGVDILEHTIATLPLEREPIGVWLSASRPPAGEMRWQSADHVLWAAAGMAPDWLHASGLALDTDGFASIGPTLQSRSHAEVFACGDIAGWSGGLAKSGVHAVRQGKTLAAGIRAMIDGTTPPIWRPRRRSLHLLAGGDGTALAAWGPLTATGTWAWRWKDRLDRAFVAT